MAPPKVMKNVTAVMSGTFVTYKHSQVKKYIEEHGGTTSASVTEKCTHLVTTQKDVDGGKVKVQQATDFPEIKAVSIEWLLDSIEGSKKLDEGPYLITASGSTSNPSNGTNQPAGKTSKTPNLSKPLKGNSQSGTNASMAIDPSSDDVVPKDTKISGKKRSRSESVTNVKTSLTGSQADEPPTKKMKDGQKAKSGSLHVPVDENCPLATSHCVYITDGKDGYPQSTIMDVTLNQSNSNNNNNKFYRLQVLVSMLSNDYICWTRWGRIGERGQNKQLGDGSINSAFAAFEKKFKEKTGHKWINRYDTPKEGLYTFLERDYEESSSEIGQEDEVPGAGSRRDSKQSTQSNKSVQCTLAQPVQRLMEMIFNQQYFAQTLTDMNYDAAKLPLGKLSKRTLNNGFTILKSLAQVVAAPLRAMQDHGMDYGQAIERLTNQYYTTIPHVFGRNRPPMINNEQMIKREVDLLEALTDMEIADEIMKDTKLEDENGNIMHPLDRQFAGLGLQEMTPLKQSCAEFLELENYLVSLKGSTHGLHFKVQDIFRIEREGEDDRFQNSPFSKVQGSDRRLLWHGSRCTNFGGILSQGLRIAPPEAPVSGYMFGKGVYLADVSSKSANYCYASASANVGILLLCEAELGKPMLELTDANYNAGDDAKARGCLTTFGQGEMRPKGWKDAGCVHKNLQGVQMPNAKLGQTNGADGGKSYSLLYNEYIAYDIAQIRLRYLFRVEMKNVY